MLAQNFVYEFMNIRSIVVYHKSQGLHTCMIQNKVDQLQFHSFILANEWLFKHLGTYFVEVVAKSYLSLPCSDVLP